MPQQGTGLRNSGVLGRESDRAGVEVNLQHVQVVDVQFLLDRVLKFVSVIGVTENVVEHITITVSA